MFTGLVQEIGTVKRLRRIAAGTRWTIAAPTLSREMSVGDSINIAGACQTLEEVDGLLVSGTAIPETLRVTTYGTWRVGTKVNLEPAMRAADRFGGHLVSGHVDATGKVSAVRKDSDGYRVRIDYSNDFDSWVLIKGSVAIDGVSLTIASRRRGSLEVALIPETLTKTTLGNLKTGDKVNIEFDQMVKAVVAHVSQVMSHKNNQTGAINRTTVPAI